MNYPDFLLTFAQIVGVFVGFANLATVFDRSKLSEANWTNHKLRLLLITEGGILLIACCFTPHLVFFFSDDEYQALKISSISSLIVFSGNTAFCTYRFKKSAGPLKLFQKMLLALSVCFACIPLLISAVFSLELKSMIGLYCFSVFSIFFILSVVFVRLFRAIVE